MALHQPTPWLLARELPGRRIEFRSRSSIGWQERWEPDFAPMLHELFEMLDGGVALPVFADRSAVTVERGQWIADLQLMSPGPLRVVDFRLQDAVRRPPLSLPLRVGGIAVGPHPVLERATPLGLELVESAHPDDLRPVLDAEPDVLVTSTRALRAALEAVEGGTVRLVLASEVDERFVGWDQLRVPDGVAVAVGGGEGFAEKVLAGIAADLPIHEAVRRVDPQALVCADPLSNDGLRIGDLVEEVARRAAERTTQWEAITRLVDAAPEQDLRARLGLTGPFRALRMLDASGLSLMRSRDEPSETPLARIAAEAQRLAREASPMQRLLAAVRLDPELAAAVDQARERRVDLALRSPDGTSAAGPPAPGAERVIALRIGRELPDSLLTHPGPAVDVLLPELEPGADGHDLDVTVFGLDFAVIGPASRPLRLPRWQPSALLALTVRAPAEPMPLARARVALYHRGHLVQSFLLSTGVGEGGPLPAFALEFSRSSRLTDLDAIGPRALSIAVNENPGGGGHTLMVKSPSGEAGVPFNADLVSRSIGDARELLQRMKTALAVAPHYSAPETPRPLDDELRAWWRLLAQLGQGAYRNVLQAVGQRQEDVVLDLNAVDDAPIQIARLDPGFAYPWTLLYDWIVPDVSPETPIDVCLGAPGCGHGPGAPVICVNGFWGVRHRLEQVVGLEVDVPRPIRPAPGVPRVRLAMGIDDDYTRALRKHFEGLGTVGEVDAADDAGLTADLWDAAWRSAAIVVVAHHEDGQGGSCLRLRAEPELALTREQVFARLQLARSWHLPPNSIMLLMACGSGTATTARIDDFATLLSRVGAGGVVATELDIDTDLAARCARDVTSRLLEGASLGAAMQGFYRGLARTGNPFAFSFFAIGDADMEVAAP